MVRPAALLLAASAFELTAHLRSRGAFPELDALFWRVATPASPDYLAFRSVSALAELAGAGPEDVAAAQAWLQSLNGRSIRVSALRDTVTATFDGELLGAEPQRAWSARGLPLAHLQPAGVLFVTRRDLGLAPTAPQPLGAERAARYGIAEQKRAYDMPTDVAATNPETLQMVWGPGTFGFAWSDLAEWKRDQCPGLNLDKVHFDTANHGTPGGDNFGEGSLDITMIASFGMNASTLVSNTNTSLSTEEGTGFGLALLDFLVGLAARATVPHVLSLSLGSLSPRSCELLCDKAAATGEVTLAECRAYLQTQRQVCMFLSTDQAAKINTALMVLGLRGVSVFGSSGDGGSHWSFAPFSGSGRLPRVLNQIGCEYQFPIWPAPSPYMVSVGGTEWRGGDPARGPVMWPGSGGGFDWEFPQPTHQRAVVQHYLDTTADLPSPASYNASGRAYPDISAVAVEGTSQSSPTFAGIFTQIVDRRLTAGLKPLGPLGPRIWHVAQAYPGEAFQDVTSGNSKTTCATGFPASEGWDPVTGWGQPLWPGLLQHFASDDVISEVLV